MPPFKPFRVKLPLLIAPFDLIDLYVRFVLFVYGITKLLKEEELL